MRIGNINVTVSNETIRTTNSDVITILCNQQFSILDREFRYFIGSKAFLENTQYENLLPEFGQVFPIKECDLFCEMIAQIIVDSKDVQKTFAIGLFNAFELTQKYGFASIAIPLTTPYLSDKEVIDQIIEVIKKFDLLYQNYSLLRKVEILVDQSNKVEFIQSLIDQKTKITKWQKFLNLLKR